MRAWWTAAALGLWIGAPAAADLGAPLAGGRAGAFEVQVLVAPAPLRVGLSEWNVLVTEADGGPVLLDADVELALRAPRRTRPAEHGAGMHRHQHEPGVLDLHPSPGATDNGLFHGAFAELDAAGTWGATVQVRRGDATGSVTFDVAVAPAASPLRDHWRAFSVVPVGLAIFLLHQGLRLRSPRRAGSVQR